eukprot:jgi/Tetstr1/444171/TSEL_032065.t1
MLGNDDGKGAKHVASTGSSTVSPARFGELEASVTNLAALLRDSLAAPAPSLSTTRDFYNIVADETSRILSEKRLLVTLDQYRSLNCYGFCDAVAHAALDQAAAGIEGATSQDVPPSAADIGVLKAAIAAYGASNQRRRDFLAYLRFKAAGDADAGGGKTLAEITCARLLRPRYTDNGLPAVASVREELLQRQADYTVTAGGKAAVNQRFSSVLTGDKPAPKPATVSAAP